MNLKVPIHFNRLLHRLPGILGRIDQVRLGWILLLPVLIALLYAAPDVVMNLRAWNRHETPSWVIRPTSQGAGAGPNQAGNIDTKLIHDGLLAAPHFRDTFRWWTGPWVGQVPFYRPLTSLLFWSEWKFWGDQEPRYNLIAVLLHLGAVGALVWLAWNLFDLFALPRAKLGALIAGLCFITGLLLLSEQPAVNEEIFSLWKNQPDALCLLFFALSLACYFRQIVQDRGSTSPLPTILKGSVPRLRRDIPLRLSFLLYLACCCSKESGLFLPILLPLFEFRSLFSPGEARRAAWRRLLPMLLTLPAFLIYRTWCLGTFVGYRYGTGGAWGYELGLNSFGPASQMLILRDWPVIGLSFCLLTLTAFQLSTCQQGHRTERPSLYIALLPLAIFVGLLLATSFLFVLVDREEYPDVPSTLVGLMLPDNVLAALRTSIYVLLMISVFRSRFQMGVFHLSW